MNQPLLRRPSALAFAALCFSGAFVACPGGGQQVATVASVAVAGPTSNALKLNEEVTFTATAKDASGNAVSGKTFVWASSDTNIATVDASNGKVTARRFGTVTISAAVDGKTGSSAQLTTYGLEAAGGTYVIGGQAGVGTSFLFKARRPDGSAPTAPAAITVTGPTGFAIGTGLTMATNSGTSRYNGYRSLSTVAVSGGYQASTVVDGETYTASFAIDAASKLDPPAVQVSNVTSAGLNASWPAVAGSVVYRVSLVNTTPNPAVTLSSGFIKGTGASISNQTLDFAANAYFLTVVAYNADLSQADPVLPSQYNSSLGDLRVPNP